MTGIKQNQLHVTNVAGMTEPENAYEPPTKLLSLSSSLSRIQDITYSLTAMTRQQVG